MMGAWTKVVAQKSIPVKICRFLFTGQQRRNGRRE